MVLPRQGGPNSAGKVAVYMTTRESVIFVLAFRTTGSTACQILQLPA